MNELNWKRKEYETWDEAFKGLAPVIRQQSVRVASYTQVLFVQACAVSFAKKTEDGAERMRGQYADLAYKCGMYHQLGKALVPPEYQILQNDFTEEELAVYRKYTTDGRALVASLQDRGTRAKEKRRGDIQELPTKNIPWLMLRETCEQHMERWDGTGYPGQRRGMMISPIAQIVGLAKELDRLAAETKSETPFEEAYQTLLGESGKMFSPELIEVLKTSEEKCREVYNKFINYTMTLPKTIPLVDKRQGRPMGLTFRPMIGGKEGSIVAYEAIPWFGGIAGRPEETESADELAQMLKRTKLVSEVAFYFLYEAADAVLRIENCKLPLNGILLQMLPDFYTAGSQMKRLDQLFQDQPVDRTKLMMTIPEKTVIESNATTRDTVQRYLRNGLILVLDGFHPGSLSIDGLKEWGFTHVRVAPELYLKQETAAAMAELSANGITLVGGGADNHDVLGWLKACGVSYMSGTINGVPVTEDELIRDSLARERKS